MEDSLLQNHNITITLDPNGITHPNQDQTSITITPEMKARFRYMAASGVYGSAFLYFWLIKRRKIPLMGGVLFFLRSFTDDQLYDLVTLATSELFDTPLTAPLMTVSAENMTVDKALREHIYQQIWAGVRKGIIWFLCVLFVNRVLS
ncbi:hypothetical protein RND81_10G182700 [Saponaria officinalis]|uniref:Uncharacterized protein n=1 Tax=Saponaria officinalis TaxID=3572 RepID=A0AAW1I3T2_SAPOF